MYQNRQIMYDNTLMQNLVYNFFFGENYDFNKNLIVINNNVVKKPLFDSDLYIFNYVKKNLP